MTPTLERGIAAHEAGRLDEAQAAYQSVLIEDPAHADALHLLGLVACDRGDAATGLARVEQALRLNANDAAFHNTRAMALTLLNRPGEAEAAYGAAFRLRPDVAAIANNLGCLLRGSDTPAKAIDWFWRASALAPGCAEIAVNLAQALAAIGAYPASLMQFEHALLLQPDRATTLYAHGHLQLLLGHAAEAEASFAAAVRLRPDHAASHNNLGIALERQGRGAAAAQCFRDALRCDPNNADAQYNLGCLLLLDNLPVEARACHAKALELAPLHGRALWARCMAELPVLYETPAEIVRHRERYCAALSRLASARSHVVRTALAGSIGSSQPFFLPYQGCCDRPLQAQYGELLASLITADPAVSLAEPPAPGERLVLGIVTGHANEHTLWRLMIKGWLSHIDRRRFAVYVYYTGTLIDAETAVAQRLADRFIGGPGEDPRAAILADRPHVLLYPELGMDPLCARLAAERLALVQCAAWGQPQTSGLPTIDYFLSGAAMEPPGAAAHYTEQLVRLPLLGVHPMLQNGRAAACTRSEFGLRDSATAFWCGQAVYKYLPQYDEVFARIAKAVPDSQFIFIGFAKSWVTTLQFHSRLGGAFTRHGLDPAHHIVMLDSMDQAHFQASVRACDIVLDSIGWSGGKSTLDMLADAPVIVTCEGELMRGRHTAAILRCLGLTETIVQNVDDYVAMAIRLAGAPDQRARLSAGLQLAGHWLTDDLSPVRGLEEFLLEAMEARRGAGPHTWLGSPPALH